MLSQAAMNRLGNAAAGMYGAADAGGLMEWIVYESRASASALPVLHRVQARLREYRLGALTTGEILPTDRECRLQTRLVTWTPGYDDELVRESDGSRWRVKGPVRGGPGHAWYKLQIGRVG